ncbi:hypothetical protein PCANB_001420 [Pneumocystis canis]|nr:hypothetical protein PCANB_001420 [Pneumocystis canis]
MDKSLSNNSHDMDSLSLYFQDSDESSVDWEDVEIHQNSSIKDDNSLKDSDRDFDISLNKSKYLNLKRKASTTNCLDRSAKIHMHLLHLTCLVFHGFIRNKWINDEETQNILRNKFQDECSLLFEKIEKYKLHHLDQQPGYWSFEKILSLILEWFKQKFEIIALGMGKTGFYSTESSLDSKDDKTYLFETIESVFEFRKIALLLKGSRDSGMQIFTSLLRALGFNARLIFSLQPLDLNFDLKDHKNFEECYELRHYSLNRKMRNSGKLHIKKSKNKLDNILIKSEENLFNDKTKLISDLSFPYPVFWTEVYNYNTDTWYSVECMVLDCIIASSDKSAFIPKGRILRKIKMNVNYIVAFEVDGYTKDVTFKYLNNISRLNRLKLPVLERDKYISFEKLVNIFKRPILSDSDLKENNDLLLKTLPKKIEDITINEYKTHPDYILERHLKREEVVRPGAFPVYVFTLGKGNKLKEERVFKRSDILLCKSVEYYHREGKQIKLGELPLKIVKPRSVTLTRRRENELIASQTNKHVTQPLYAEFQTELYIPPPVINGIIPKNGYGNTNVFVDSMIPKGATHLPYDGIGKIAKKLGFDYSDAVTGFQFKHQRAIPIITGILVATENVSACFEAWLFEEQKRIEKEIKKRQKEVLGRWRRFFLGLRIRDRIQNLYSDSYNSFFSSAFTRN